MNKEIIVDGDLGEVSLDYYLANLLKALWIQDEGFSGKRPFGNSGWQFDVAYALCKAGVIDCNWEWSPDSNEDPKNIGNCDSGEWRFDWSDVTSFLINRIEEKFGIKFNEVIK